MKGREVQDLEDDEDVCLTDLQIEEDIPKLS